MRGREGCPTTAVATEVSRQPFVLFSLSLLLVPFIQSARQIRVIQFSHTPAKRVNLSVRRTTNWRRPIRYGAQHCNLLPDLEHPFPCAHSELPHSSNPTWKATKKKRVPTKPRAAYGNTKQAKKKRQKKAQRVWGRRRSGRIFRIFNEGIIRIQIELY